MLCSSLLLGPLIASAQETDTTTINIREEQEESRSINLGRQFDRSISGGSLTEMGTFDVPRENQYYQRPFKGQEYLDMAVQAYREQLKSDIDGGWFWQFLKTVSPYIRLEMGAFETMQLQYIDRDHPAFESYNSDEKLE